MITDEAQVNAILGKWNPLEVPEFIAKDEYRIFVKEILTTGKSKHKLEAYLKAFVEHLGLEFDENCAAQLKEIQRVADEIHRVYKAKQEKGSGSGK